MIKIAINNKQTTHKIDEKRLVQAARMILEEEGVKKATISLAIVDDPTIHDLNRRFLKHDYPTDVLSFVLDDSKGRLDAEVIASADTAALMAEDYGWSAAEELLLYIVHGMLHLVDYDDKLPTQRRAMRAREKYYLEKFGVEHRFEEDV